MQRLDKDLLLGCIATTIGGIALLVAVAFGVDRARFFSRAEATTGKVVASKDNPRSNMLRRGEIPVVEFSASDGKVHQFEGYSAWPPRYHVGNEVDLYYVVGDPDDARLDDFIELWLWPSIFGAIAVVFFPIGLVVLLGARRRRRLRALRDTGVVVRGAVVHAETSAVQEWGKTMQKLVVEAPDPTTGAPRRYESHRVPGEGDQWLGKQLDVFVDPDDPRRFLVDVAET